ncbi:MAG: hypothetical protein ACHQRJ_09000 [Alphaproteobacteria bacterium]
MGYTRRRASWAGCAAAGAVLVLAAPAPVPVAGAGAEEIAAACWSTRRMRPSAARRLAGRHVKSPVSGTHDRRGRLRFHAQEPREFVLPGAVAVA